MDVPDDWFGLDANYIRPDVFPDGEFIIWFHPRYKTRPVKWFTPTRVEKFISKGHAMVTAVKDATQDNVPATA
jgi:hypothetical protein